MSEDDPCNLWFFLGLLQVDQEDLHQVTKHSGNADLNNSKFTYPPPKFIGHSSRV